MIRIIVSYGEPYDFPYSNFFADAAHARVVDKDNLETWRAEPTWDGKGNIADILFIHGDREADDDVLNDVIKANKLPPNRVIWAIE